MARKYVSWTPNEWQKMADEVKSISALGSVSDAKAVKEAMAVLPPGRRKKIHFSNATPIMKVLKGIWAGESAPITKVGGWRNGGKKDATKLAAKVDKTVPPGPSLEDLVKNAPARKPAQVKVKEVKGISNDSSDFLAQTVAATNKLSNEITSLELLKAILTQVQAAEIRMVENMAIFQTQVLARLDKLEQAVTQGNEAKLVKDGTVSGQLEGFVTKVTVKETNGVIEPEYSEKLDNILRHKHDSTPAPVKPRVRKPRVLIVGDLMGRVQQVIQARLSHLDIDFANKNIGGKYDKVYGVKTFMTHYHVFQLNEKFGHGNWTLYLGGTRKLVHRIREEVIPTS